MQTSQFVRFKKQILNMYFCYKQAVSSTTSVYVVALKSQLMPSSQHSHDPTAKICFKVRNLSDNRQFTSTSVSYS